MVHQWLSGITVRAALWLRFDVLDFLAAEDAALCYFYITRIDYKTNNIRKIFSVTNDVRCATITVEGDVCDAVSLKNASIAA
jgi:hypothetical protein